MINWLQQTIAPLWDLDTQPACLQSTALISVPHSCSHCCQPSTVREALWEHSVVCLARGTLITGVARYALGTDSDTHLVVLPHPSCCCQLADKASPPQPYMSNRTVSRNSSRKSSVPVRPQCMQLYANSDCCRVPESHPCFTAPCRPSLYMHSASLRTIFPFLNHNLLLRRLTCASSSFFFCNSTDMKFQSHFMMPGALMEIYHIVNSVFFR